MLQTTIPNGPLVDEEGFSNGRWWFQDPLGVHVFYGCLVLPYNDVTVSLHC